MTIKDFIIFLLILGTLNAVAAFIFMKINSLL